VISEKRYCIEVVYEVISEMLYCIRVVCKQYWIELVFKVTINSTKMLVKKRKIVAF
jgi:hypothetical protein